jgi:glycine oxidase
VLVGSTEGDVGYDKSNTAEAVERLKSFAYELAPALRSAEVEQTWAGLRPYAADDKPYLGRLPALQNAYVAAGHYRWGLTLSTSTAVVMAQLLAGEPTLVDLAEFRVNRTTESR